MQCVAILIACKSDSDDTQTLVNARDRGGLCNNFSLNVNVFFALILLFFQSKLFVKI